VRVVLENIGPIKKADVSTGDLTILVGPQATGKSIFLQLFKFCVDHANIVKELKKFGFDWKNELESFLPVYFGEGMQAIWNSQSRIELNGRNFQIETHFKKSGGADSEAKVFYIPAQRVLIISAGWPLPFTSFDPTYPFVVKDFSEKIRRIMDSGLGSGGTPIFPRGGYFKKEIRDALQKSIMREGILKLDIGLRKRIMLEVAGVSMPIMTWSAGQREFCSLITWIVLAAAPGKSLEETRCELGHCRRAGSGSSSACNQGCLSHNSRTVEQGLQSLALNPFFGNNRTRLGDKRDCVTS